MASRSESMVDLFSACLLALFGAAALWFGRDLPTGSWAAMESGNIPLALGWVLIAFAVAVGARALWSERAEGAGHDSDARRFALRPLLGITGSVAVFGLFIETLGLVITVPLSVLVAGLAHTPFKPRATLAAAAGLSAGTAILFVSLLGLNIPLWPQ